MTLLQRAFGANEGHCRRLGVILIVGFLLRVANISWGIPISPFTSFYHADEVKAWGSVVDFPGNYFTSTNYLYGTAIQYSVGLVLLPVKVIMTRFFVLEDSYTLVAIVFFRFANVLMGTAGIWLVYDLGRKLFDERTGLWASALTCVSTAHCLNSCLCTLDVPMSFLLLLALLQCLRAFETGRASSFALLGLYAGLLLGTKFTGGFFMVVPFVLAVLRRAPVTDRLFFVFLPIALAVFVISTPHVVLSPDEYYEFMMSQKANWYNRPPATLGGILRAWATATSTAIGAPAAILVPLGFLSITKPRLAKKLLVAIFVISYLAFWRAYLPPNFVIFVAPLLCLFAAAACVRLFEQRRTLLRRTGTVVVACAIVWPAVLSLAGVLQRYNDARTQASRYIAETIPPGTTIGIATDSDAYQWRHHQWRYPKIDFEIHREVHFLLRPEILVVTSLETEMMQQALRSDKLHEGYVWDAAHRRNWYKNTPPSPAVFRFYADLFEGTDYERIKEFSHPVHVGIGGISPAITIYRKTHADERLFDPD